MGILKAIQANWTKNPQILNEQAAIIFLIQLGYTTDFDPSQSYVWNGEQEE